MTKRNSANLQERLSCLKRELDDVITKSAGPVEELVRSVRIVGEGKGDGEGGGKVGWGSDGGREGDGDGEGEVGGKVMVGGR